MSHYILDTLEALIYENTRECDLVRRRIIGFLGSKEVIRIKSQLTSEWVAANMEYESDDDTLYDNDFRPYDIEDDD